MCTCQALGFVLVDLHIHQSIQAQEHVFVFCSVWIVMVTRGYLLRVALLAVLLMVTSTTVSKLLTSFLHAGLTFF